MRNKFDTCMFCMKNPCECNAKPKPAKKAAAKRTPAQPAQPATPKVDPDVARMQERARKRAIRTDKPKVTSTGTAALDADTIEAARAVRVLAEAGMLSAEDRAQYRWMLDIAYQLPSDLKVRLLQWKMNRTN